MKTVDSLHLVSQAEMLAIKYMTKKLVCCCLVIFI